MICPSCKSDLQGGLIFDTGMELHGNDEAKALEYAQFYGATKTEGHWGRELAIYSFGEDKTVAYRCPDCEHIWERT